MNLYAGKRAVINVINENHLLRSGTIDRFFMSLNLWFGSFHVASGKVLTFTQ